MTLLERISTDLNEAMKSGDRTRKSALRMMKAAIKNAEIAKRQPLDEVELLTVLSREVKQRRESIDEFRKANRQDAVAKEEAELSVVLEYLPQQMAKDEIESLIRQIVEQVGAEGPRDKGKVMSQLMPQVKGKAEGRIVNEVVTQVLESI